MILLVAETQGLLPEISFPIELVVPKGIAVVFGGVWRLQCGQRRAGVVGFAIAGSEEKGNCQYAKLE